MAHLWHAAAGQPTGFETERDERVEYHRNEARKSFQAVGRLLLPWYKKWRESDGKSLAELYRQFKARESDPGYAVWLKEERQRLTKLRQDSAQSAEALKLAAADLRAMRGTQDRRRRRGSRGRLFQT